MWLDKLIGSIAPETGARRMIARIKMQHAAELLRGYDGATSGRRTDGWVTASSSASAEMFGARGKLRDRARDLVRNNPYATKAVSDYHNYVIGTGIVPRVKLVADERKKYKEVWKRWSNECDPEGLNDFGGLQSLIAGSEFESGEVFVRFRNRYASDGLKIPLQIEVLEADYLDTLKNNEGVGNRIIQGIEYNVFGKRVAYWMHKEHPGNLSSYSTLASVRIPAEDIIHVFRRTRPGQPGGVTAFYPVITRLKDLADYQDAELMRKKIASCFVAFVKQAGDASSPLGNAEVDKKSGDRIEKMKPGMIGYLKANEDVEFGSPSSDGEYSPFVNSKLHEVAAGLLTTYDRLTGDLSQANYSSLRAGGLGFKRSIERVQYQLYCFRLCHAIQKRVYETAAIAGMIDNIDAPTDWMPPPMDMVDPIKDAQAEILLTRAGMQTWKQMVDKQGYDPDEQLAEIAETNKQLDSAKVIVDSDPRNVSQSGIYQFNNTNNTQS
jgi:lambda family phage portal protein